MTADRLAPQNSFSLCQPASDMDGEKTNDKLLQACIACRLGLGGIVQIWLRGTQARDIVSQLVKTGKGNGLSCIQPGELRHGFLTGSIGIIDEVMLAGTEWGVELNCHGGTIPAQLAMQLLINNGFVELKPEEWWLSRTGDGELSLPECEMYLALPQAVTELQAMLLCQAGAQLSHAVLSITEQLLNASAQTMAKTISEIEAMLAGYAQAKAILGKHRLAICGAPNVGKSTLFNCLAGHERALVSPVEGTTRDPVRFQLNLHGLQVEAVDTAGLLAEAAGADHASIKLAQAEAGGADIRLLVIDASRALSQADYSAWEMCGQDAVVAINKADLKPQLTKQQLQEKLRRRDGQELAVNTISAIAGDGVDELAEALACQLWASQTGASERPQVPPMPCPFTHRQAGLLRQAGDQLALGNASSACQTLQRIALPGSALMMSELEIIRQEARKDKHGTLPV